MIVLAMAGGCGDSGGPGTTDASGGGSDFTIQPAVTTNVGVSPMSSGSPVPATAGKVEVRLARTSYEAGGVVRVTVANGLGHNIYTEDFKTVCSIVTLQRAESGGWKGLEGCVLGRPTMTVTIGPGLGFTVDIDPDSVHFRDGGNRIEVGPGTYRVKFGYRLAPGNSGEESLVAYSPEFTVR